MHAPETQEGHEVWSIIRLCGGQVLLAPSGQVVGFDYMPMLTAADALGYCKQSFLWLIKAAENGMLKGLRETQNGDT